MSESRQERIARAADLGSRIDPRRRFVPDRYGPVGGLFAIGVHRNSGREFKRRMRLDQRIGVRERVELVSFLFELRIMYL